MKETKWLTVKEASLLCYKLNLPRSIKTIRRWCLNENIEAQKRKVGKGEMWFIDQESLEIKIKEELEFLKHSQKSISNTFQSSGHMQDISAPERLQADTCANERTEAPMSAHRVDMSEQPNIRDLEDKITSLKVDVAVNSKLADEFKEQFLKGQKMLQAQSRYIGHVETKILKLGGSTDQTFLEAPVPKSRASEGIENTTEPVNPDIIHNQHSHSDQGNLYTG